MEFFGWPDRSNLFEQFYQPQQNAWEQYKSTSQFHISVCQEYFPFARKRLNTPLLSSTENGILISNFSPNFIPHHCCLLLLLSKHFSFSCLFPFLPLGCSSSSRSGRINFIILLFSTHLRKNQKTHIFLLAWAAYSLPHHSSSSLYYCCCFWLANSLSIPNMGWLLLQWLSPIHKCGEAQRLINLEIPVLVRSLKSSNVEPG